MNQKQQQQPVSALPSCLTTWADLSSEVFLTTTHNNKMPPPTLHIPILNTALVLHVNSGPAGHAKSSFMDSSSPSSEQEKHLDWNLQTFKSLTGSKQKLNSISKSSCSSSANSSSSRADCIGAMAFDPDCQWLATGGKAKKICLYDFGALLLDPEKDDQEEDRDFCKTVICTAAKLSSLKWDPNSGFSSSIVASGDYDGVVTEWDLQRGLSVSERDEHGGRRVWSVDYCRSINGLCASASDDGTVQLWDNLSSTTVMALKSPSGGPVCCAEFGGSSGLLVAMACSDSGIYVFDSRYCRSAGCGSSSSSSAAAKCLVSLRDHSRAASYVRFFGDSMLVSSAIDESIKLWDISGATEEEEEALVLKPIRSFRGHRNRQNFVGLSVWPQGGLIACGSEENQLFVYDQRWSSPVWVHQFLDSHHHDDNAHVRVGQDNFANSAAPFCGSQYYSHSSSITASASTSTDDRNSVGFVACVCWSHRPSPCTLIAANSLGMLQVIVGDRK